MPDSFDDTVVPVSPAMIRLRSASAPIAAVFPVAAANRHAAATFGPIEPAANGIAMRAAGDARRIAFCVGLPQSMYTAVGVGQHHEEIGVEVSRASSSDGEILVDDAFDAGQRASRAQARTWSGCRRRRRR